MADSLNDKDMIRWNSTIGAFVAVPAGTSGQMVKYDTNGLPVNATNTDTDVASAVSLKHARSHAITSSSDHTGTAGDSGYMMKADANGLPVKATNTDANVSDAVTKRHTQGTDQGLDTGGANASTAANVKSAVDLRHNAVTLATDHGLSLSTQVLAMGTPSTLTAATTNAVTTTTHTHSVTGFATGAGSASGANSVDITLATSADVLLALTGQALSLDTQTANYIFAGRVDAGTALAPTFRAMVAADMGTTLTPQFTAIELGHATDTTLARSGAGDITIEGKGVYRADGTDVPVADGGTGASTAAMAFGNIKQAASESETGVIEIATNAETATGTDTSRAITPNDLKFRHDTETENGSEDVWYPQISGSVVDTGSAQTLTNKTLTSPVISNATASKVAILDGSKVLGSGSNTDAELADAVSKKHSQNTDTGTTATSFKINSSGYEADIQTTGLTADRDYTFPDVDTMLAGAVCMAQNGFEIIAY